MREISFEWDGATLRISPSFLLTSRIAQELRKVSEGSETTISLAYKCVHGGLEPVFLMVPLMQYLREALKEKAPGEQEVFEKIVGDPALLMSFRLAYVQAMLPNVEMGKDPAAPQEQGADRKKTAPRTQSGSTKRSTSKPSTKRRG